MEQSGFKLPPQKELTETCREVSTETFGESLSSGLRNAVDGSRSDECEDGDGRIVIVKVVVVMVERP